MTDGEDHSNAAASPLPCQERLPLVRGTFVQAKFPLKPEKERQLALVVGQVLRLRRDAPHDAAWLRCETTPGVGSDAGGRRRGLVPMAYVRILMRGDHRDLAMSVVAVYPLEPSQEQRASGVFALETGDVLQLLREPKAGRSWWRVRRGKERGMVPAAYVQRLVPATSLVGASPSTTREPRSGQQGESDTVMVRPSRAPVSDDWASMSTAAGTTLIQRLGTNTTHSLRLRRKVARGSGTLGKGKKGNMHTMRPSSTAKLRSRATDASNNPISDSESVTNSGASSPLPLSSSKDVSTEEEMDPLDALQLRDPIRGLITDGFAGDVTDFRKQLTALQAESMRSCMSVRKVSQQQLLGKGDCIAPYSGSLFDIERGDLSQRHVSVTGVIRLPVLPMRSLVTGASPAVYYVASVPAIVCACTQVDAASRTLSMVVVTKDGATPATLPLDRLPGSGNVSKRLTKYVRQHMYAKQRVTVVSDGPATKFALHQLLHLEALTCTNARRFGVAVVYCAPNQATEASFLANRAASSAFDDFIHLLTGRTSKHTQGALGTRWKGYEFHLHVAHRLTVEEQAHLLRDDLCVVYFQEGTPFQALTFGSSVNAAGIVVQPQMAAAGIMYRLAAFRRAQIPVVVPSLPAPPLFAAAQLRDFILAKVVHMSQAALRSPPLRQVAESVCLRSLKSIVGVLSSKKKWPQDDSS